MLFGAHRHIKGLSFKVSLPCLCGLLPEGFSPPGSAPKPKNCSFYYRFICSVGFQRDRPPEGILLGIWDSRGGWRTCLRTRSAPAGGVMILGLNQVWNSIHRLRWAQGRSLSEIPTHRQARFFLMQVRWSFTYTDFISWCIHKDMFELKVSVGTKNSNRFKKNMNKLWVK